MCLRRVQATQRAGRAGRTRNGKCYRLYTQKYFERDMPAETLPEIQRTSMLTAVLFLKSLPLDIDVLAFDYLDHPGVSLLSVACLHAPVHVQSIAWKPSDNLLHFPLALLQAGVVETPPLRHIEMWDSTWMVAWLI